MTPTPADRLAPLLHALRAAPPPFARAVATDADGTLWDADVGDRLFLLVAERELFRGLGVGLLRAAAARWLGRDDPARSPGALARALFDRYSAGAVDVASMCELEAASVGDRPAAEFEALVSDVAAGALDAVRPEVRALLHAARAAGAAIHVVTGSLGAVVEATLRRAGLPFDRVSGAELALEAGHVRAELSRPAALFEGKVRALREGPAWPPALGLGDGGWDHTFLREAHLPVLVYPKPALLEAMRDVPRALVWPP